MSGIFAEDDSGRITNTPLSELLSTEVPGSLRDPVLLFGDETFWRSWQDILHAVRTGEAAFEHVYGEKFFDYLQSHPDTAAMFDRAMASASSTTNVAVIEAYDFSAFATLADIAGGVGSTLCSVLGATVEVRGPALLRGPASPPGWTKPLRGGIACGGATNYSAPSSPRCRGV